MDENKEIDYNDPDPWRWYGSGYRYLDDDEEV